MKLRQLAALILCFCLMPCMGVWAEAEENSLILNFGGKGETDYRIMGEVETPQGYDRAPYTLKEEADPREQRFQYRAQDENHPVQSVYIGGVAGKTGDFMLQVLRMYNIYAPLGADREVEIAGHKARYMLAVGAPSSTKPDIYSLMVFLYVDVLENSTVSFSFESAHVPAALLPTEEEMLTDVEAFLACFTAP